MFPHFLLAGFHSQNGVFQRVAKCPGVGASFCHRLGSRPPTKTHSSNWPMKRPLEECFRNVALCRRREGRNSAHRCIVCLIINQKPAGIATEQISRPVGAAQDGTKAESVAGGRAWATWPRHIFRITGRGSRARIPQDGLVQVFGFRGAGHSGAHR